jgi:hypothetical protein
VVDYILIDYGLTHYPFKATLQQFQSKINRPLCQKTLQLYPITITIKSHKHYNQAL